MTTPPRYKGKYRIESTRLPDRGIIAIGWYFVTICTHNRQHSFGEIVASQMRLSEIGKIAQQFWLDIPQHFNYTYIDACVIMPNHVHGIIVIDRPTALSSMPTPVGVGKTIAMILVGKPDLTNISSVPIREIHQELDK